VQAILDHRREISRTLLTAGVIGLAFLALLFAATVPIDGPVSIPTMLYFAALMTGLGIFTACVFGGWKIAIFAIQDPPRRRADLVYLIAFTIWVAWTLFTALYYFMIWAR